jgi:hypothetical protein
MPSSAQKLGTISEIDREFTFSLQKKDNMCFFLGGHIFSGIQIFGTAINYLVTTREVYPISRLLASRRHTSSCVWLVLNADADTDAEAAAASVCRSPSRRLRAILAQVLTFGSGKSRSRLAQVQNGPLDRFFIVYLALAGLPS